MDDGIGAECGSSDHDEAPVLHAAEVEMISDANLGERHEIRERLGTGEYLIQRFLRLVRQSDCFLEAQGVAGSSENRSRLEFATKASNSALGIGDELHAVAL